MFVVMFVLVQSLGRWLVLCWVVGLCMQMWFGCRCMVGKLFVNWWLCDQCVVVVWWFSRFVVVSIRLLLQMLVICVLEWLVCVSQVISCVLWQVVFMLLLLIIIIRLFVLSCCGRFCIGQLIFVELCVFGGWFVIRCQWQLVGCVSCVILNMVIGFVRLSCWKLGNRMKVMWQVMCYFG